MRYMIDNKITGMSWVKIKKGLYSIRETMKMSTCQIEIDIIDYRNLKAVPVSENSKIAPLRILSFDIETSTDGIKFPTPTRDPVIQIANIVKIHGQKDPFVRNVFTLESCAQIVGTQVHSYEREKDLLRAWRNFILEVDPDIITGYNIQNFDFPYIIERSQQLMMDNYPRFSRVNNILSTIKETHTSIKVLGIRDNKEVNIEGRLQLDMLQIMQRDHKLRSYSLNSVAYEFLNE